MDSFVKRYLLGPPKAAWLSMRHARTVWDRRFMPASMRNIGLSMHDAASDFARTAKAGVRVHAGCEILSAGIDR